MRIVFAGTPDVAVPTLDALAADGHDIIAVMTRPDAPAGRGRKLMASPVARRAEELGIAVLKPVKAIDALTYLQELSPQCCPIVAYGGLLPQRMLDVPEHGWINLHFSLLPRWRGAAPVQRAIMAGDSQTGAVTFRLVRELDAGPIYRKINTTISSTDTAGVVLDRLAGLGAELMCETLSDIESGLQPAAQDETGTTVAPKITVAEAELDFTRDVLSLDHLIRGCSPAPGAWTTFRQQRLKVFDAKPSYAVLPPGVLEVTKKQVLVGTSSRALNLVRVQAHGKKPMAAPDWARGITFHPGERLGQ